MGKMTINGILKLRHHKDPRVTEVTWYSKRYISQIGDSYHVVDCPECGQEMNFYPWSLAGTGKKCENKNCETVFFGGSRGLTFKESEQ